MDLLLEQFRPEAMAVEELFFTNNITTGIGVAQARGVILLAAERRGVPIFEYSPSQVSRRWWATARRKSARSWI